MRNRLENSPHQIQSTKHVACGKSHPGADYWEPTPFQQREPDPFAPLPSRIHPHAICYMLHAEFAVTQVFMHHRERPGRMRGLLR